MNRESDSLYSCPTPSSGADGGLPLISVYLPTRNRASLAYRAAKSVLSQDYPNIELLIVDDGSTDGTAESLRDVLSDPRVQFFHFEKSGGAPAARNFAIRAANGVLITGIDDDDIWIETRLSRMESALVDDVVFVCATDIVLLPGRNVRIWRRPEHIDLLKLLRWNVVGNQVLVRTSDLIACGLFDEELLASQDYELWIRLLQNGGSAMGLTEILQIVDAGHNLSRISTSSRRKYGIWRVYRRYVSQMDRRTRKIHLFNIIRTTDRPLSLRKLMALLEADIALRMALHYFRCRFPFLVDLLVDRGVSLLDKRHAKEILRHVNLS